MESKYYIPSIEEFHVGFEYEHHQIKLNPNGDILINNRLIDNDKKFAVEMKKCFQVLCDRTTQES